MIHKQVNKIILDKDLSKRIDIGFQNDELASLSDGINEMLLVTEELFNEVAKANEELEEKVELRTEELLNSNEKLQLEIKYIEKLQGDIVHFAYHDQLTDLPNKRKFEEHAEHSLLTSKRENLKMAIFYLDLDGFKAINDTYGHAEGDNLLIMVADRLKNCLRENDIVSRIGGDEFNILFENIKENESISEISNKILEAVSKPMIIAGDSIQISISIGVAQFPNDGDTVKGLIKRADCAMYKAKEAGKNQVSRCQSKNCIGTGWHGSDEEDVYNTDDLGWDADEKCRLDELPEVLVMGGTEFVSRSIAEYFIQKKYNVTILTRGRNPILINGVKGHIICDRKVESDLKQLEAYTFDYIIDINAYTKEDVSLLLKYINKDKLKRYVFCSSGGVYQHSNEAIDENFDKGLNSLIGVYGTDKFQAENYLLDCFKNDNLPVSMFRAPYIYGNYNTIYREAYFFDMINDNQIIPLPASKNKIQFIHTFDLVRFVESLILNEKAIGQAYNISYDESLNFYEIIQIYESFLNKKAKVISVDTDQYKARSYFPYIDMPYVLSTDKLKADGLYRPQIDLLEGLNMTYEWYTKDRPKEYRHNMINREKVIEKYTI